MFSSRLPSQFTLNRYSQLLQQKKEKGELLINLAESNLTQVGLFDDVDRNQILTPLVDFRSLSYQPNPLGLREARVAISEVYYQKKGITIDPEYLVLCASTSEAYSFLFQLLADVGDKILCPAPSYPLFEQIASLSSVVMKPYFLSYEDRWRIHASCLQDAYEKQAKAMVVVHPNNPTGSFLQKQELETVFSFCAQRELALIADEVFLDYPLSLDDERASSIAGYPSHQGPLRFVLSGFSKVLGLPQFKLGWIYIAGPEPLRTQAKERLEWISDTFLSVGTPIQWAASALLQKRDRLGGKIHKRLRKNLSLLQDLVHGTACQLLQLEGGFSATLRLPNVLTEEEWVLLLLEQDRLICHPGYFYDFSSEPYLVISLLLPSDVFQEGVGRILQRVSHVIKEIP